MYGRWLQVSQVAPAGRHDRPDRRLLARLSVLRADGDVVADPTDESGILGLHKIEKRPVAGPNDEVLVRPMMYVALSYDHRLIDGRDAVTTVMSGRASFSPVAIGIARPWMLLKP